MTIRQLITNHYGYIATFNSINIRQTLCSSRDLQLVRPYTGGTHSRYRYKLATSY